jgi:hypothetical protein
MDGDIPRFFLKFLIKALNNELLTLFERPAIRRGPRPHLKREIPTKSKINASNKLKSLQNRVDSRARDLQNDPKTAGTPYERVGESCNFP